MPAERLSADEIATRLDALRDWTLAGDAIERRLQFASFLDAIAFIERIAALAEAADHHPEIFNVYDRIELRLTTHDSGGLTARDFDLASEIDGVV
jgi:4a-hydroxytetrahydrobiopterin dehydratase